jgi:2-methylcitrate dehydratase PrpD
VFNDTTLADSRVRALAKRVTIVERPQDVATMGVAMAVILKDGRKIEGHIDAFRGTPEQPFTRADVKHKFDNVTRGALSTTTRDKLFEQLLALEKVGDVRELVLF